MLIRVVVSFAALFVSTSAFAHGHCSRYENNEAYLNAIRTVASRMQYKPLELCTLPTLNDIQVVSTKLINDQGEVIPHTWVTLHYNEYSCQYFVVTADQSLTKSNCYSTW